MVSTADQRIFDELRRRQSATVRVLAVAALLLSTGGCSLISFKSPEKPLSTRDLNARILTREYSTHFIAAVEASADEISANEADTLVVTNALRWEIGATSASVRAATQIAPLMSLLDTWALALQMRDFVAEANAGGALFGVHQGSIQALAEAQADAADELARRVIPSKELPRYRLFVEDYARSNPLQDLGFLRPPIVELWSREGGAEARLVDSLGTVPEALSDVTDRMRIYGDVLPSQTLWKAELALRESGYTADDARSALRQLNERLDRITAVAQGAPDLAHDSIADVRRTLLIVIGRLNASSISMMTTLRDERLALTADVHSEREATLIAVDEQRKALALDAARISNQVVSTVGQQVRQLAREVMLLFILVAVVLLGLPFVAGYMLGRSRRPPRRAE